MKHRPPSRTVRWKRIACQASPFLALGLIYYAFMSKWEHKISSPIAGGIAGGTVGGDIKELQEKLDKKDAEIESLKAKIAIQSIRLSSTPPPTEDQATTTYAITRARMQYWPEPSKTRKLVPLRPGHFVTFEVDHGGFNNIRMGMEMAAAVAMHLGRTLVMPEAKPWYLMDNGPTHQNDLKDAFAKGETTSKFEDIFDMADLNRWMGVMSWDEYKRQQPGGQAFEFPADAQDPEVYCHNVRNELDKLKTTDEKVIYFTGDGNTRIFLCTAWFDQRSGFRPYMYKSDGQIESLLLRAIHYRPDIMDVAAHFVAKLGHFKYSSMHYRSGDFQLAGKTKAAVLVKRIAPLLGKGEHRTLYISTDEVGGKKGELQEAWAKEGIKTFFWSDMMAHCAATPACAALKASMTALRWGKLTGLFEQLICVFGDLFIGSARSTFTAGINRMRWFSHVPVPLVLVHSAPVDAVVVNKVKSMRDAWVEDPSFRDKVRRLEEMDCWTAGGKGGPGDCAPFGD